MRSAYLVLMVAGCGFRSAGSEVVPDGGVPDMHAFTAAELGAGARVDMTFDGVRGSLTPNAYSYGGLVAHGLKGRRLWTNTMTDWSLMSTVAPTGAGIWCGEHVGNKTSGTLADMAYLGVAEDTTMTLWLEGEVWLDGAAEKFHANGDDVGFVEIARPGTTAYTHLDQNATVPVPSAVIAGPGWYPIRVGFANGDGTFDFTFTHIDNGGPEIAWTRDRLRARTSELTGTLRTVFGAEILGGGLALTGNQVAPPVLHIDDTGLLTADFSDNQTGTPPQGSASQDDHWSARFTGQVYIATHGSYQLQIVSDDGNRGRLGDGRGEQTWRLNNGVGGTDAMTTVSATLGAGWNDLLVDYNQVIGGATVSVRLQGPDFPAFAAIPATKLRPVEPAGDRLATGANDTPQGIPDNGSGAATLTVAGYTDTRGGAELVDAIELSYEIDSPHRDQLTIELEAPTTSGGPGARTAITETSGRDLAGNDRLSQTTILSTSPAAVRALLGGAAAGDWTLHVADANGGQPNASTLRSARLTLHTRGGPDKVARTASWTSPVIDAGAAVFAVDRVTWSERAVAGVSKASVSVRTCSQPDCSGVDWPDSRPQGTAFNVLRGRYLQLRVDMASDGTTEPELGGLAIAFRRDPG